MLILTKKMDCKSSFYHKINATFTYQQSYLETFVQRIYCGPGKLHTEHHDHVVLTCSQIVYWSHTPHHTNNFQLLRFHPYRFPTLDLSVNIEVLQQHQCEYDQNLQRNLKTIYKKNSIELSKIRSKKMLNSVYLKKKIHSQYMIVYEKREIVIYRISNDFFFHVADR